MQAESSGFFSTEAWRHLARVGLTAAGAASVLPSSGVDEAKAFEEAANGVALMGTGKAVAWLRERAELLRGQGVGKD